MLVHLLLFVCACAQLGMAGEPKVPPYLKYKEEIKIAEAALKENILSMEGNIPLLDDPRRQYAQIVYVVTYEAIGQAGCVYEEYSEIYQKDLNSSLPLALSRPQLAIDEVNNLLERFKHKSAIISKLIHDCVGPKCDVVVDYFIKQDLQKYAEAAAIFIAAGKAAIIQNENAKKIEKITKNLDAQKFLIKGAEILKKYVLTLADLYRALNVGFINGLRC
ncbi:uncharacterized protein LOC113494560 [Trichoplusia ni]|uniref:Uncharacterized protein LOC113494560 n=1 Tax=Trichoplusia ni TaxID=7111 RepID=A0A7E5VK96_TRINI|nr:uncharacterized protein LOC113494560 [Trichoplusia ni]